MSRRWLVPAIGVVAVAATLQARADFHLTTQACANAVGEAHVGLAQDDGVFTFTGTVVCDGAFSVEITSLTLTPLLPPGSPVAGGTASCAPCDATPLVATGSAPATGPVVVTVAMEFAATGPGGEFTTGRSGRFVFITGDPIGA